MAGDVADMCKPVFVSISCLVASCESLCVAAHCFDENLCSDESFLARIVAQFVAFLSLPRDFPAHFYDACLFVAESLD